MSFNTVPITKRRFISAAKAAELRRSPLVEFTPTGCLSYDIVRDQVTDWVIVSDDDPRADTEEEVAQA